MLSSVVPMDIQIGILEVRGDRWLDLAWAQRGIAGTIRVALSGECSRDVGPVGIVVVSRGYQTNREEPTLGCRIRG